MTHILDDQRIFCETCGQDAVTCQYCGKQVCGNQVTFPTPTNALRGNACGPCYGWEQDEWAIAESNRIAEARVSGFGIQVGR